MPYNTPEKKLAYNRMYRSKNSEYVKNYNKLYVLDKKRRVVSHYSKGKNGCACCGEPQIKFLSIDHIHGGGIKHRNEFQLQGTKMYHWLINNNFPEGFRVLCYNCNMSYGFYGCCPHTEEK